LVTAAALSDDNTDEFKKTTATTVAGNWTFVNNTDGGVITNFSFPGTWTVTINPTFDAGIWVWDFVDFDSSFLPLQQAQQLILRAYGTPSPCRTDCTVPKCGDGIMDGGEVCDDGNNQGGDGCAADCNSLKG